jgi:HTH-type transcriptional regulator / antitoxin PezA
MVYTYNIKGGDNKMEMKDRIKKIRKDLDLTQQTFAEKIGTTANVLTNYETGRRNPSSSVINNMCKTFNVNEEWLRTGEGDMFTAPPKNDLIAKAAVLLGQKDPVFEAFVDTYSKLDPANRKVLIEWGLDFLNNLKQRSEDI